MPTGMSGTMNTCAIMLGDRPVGHVLPRYGHTASDYGYREGGTPNARQVRCMQNDLRLAH